MPSSNCYNISIKYLIQQIKNRFWHLPKAILANLIYTFPSRKLTLIGITGTDGKTTTAHLLHHLLVKSGIRAEVISTINSPGLHTTSPDSMVVQKIFRHYLQKGITHVVVEVTSHALDQYRFWGCHFDIGILTNIAHEHLDDFPTMDKYIRAKAKLFRHSDISILNRDDQSFKIISSSAKKNISYAIKKPADYHPTDIKITQKQLSFNLDNQKITTDSPYYYQVYNILAAYIAAKLLGLDQKLILKNLLHFPPVVGRRQEYKNSSGIKTIIDFAHTPQALGATLSSLKPLTKGKLICLFGATGGRDQSKRPLMGQIVSQIADIAIITADDTRNEDIKKINRQIIAGIDKKNKNFVFYNIPDRQKAFNLAVKLAKSGDTIVACGKGHETTILHGKTEYPWSESRAYETAFRQNDL